VNGRYVGQVAGHDPLHGFLSGILRDRLGVRQPRPAFRALRLSGSNEVYGYEEKASGTRVICKFYGPGSAGTGTGRPGWPGRSTRGWRPCAATAWSAPPTM
jgi:hypothetical protein